MIPFRTIGVPPPLPPQHRGRGRWKASNVEPGGIATSSKRIGIVIVLVALLLVAVAVSQRLIAGSGSSGPTYALAAAAYGRLSVDVTGSGTVQAATTANVYPSQAGTITAIPVTVGQQVVAGQLLATESDGGKLENQLLVAEAALAADQANLAAQTSPPPTSPAQITAQQDKIQLDQAHLAADQATLAQDQATLAALTVKAPGSGFVGGLNLIPGQPVGDGATLLTLANPAVITVSGTVLESALPSLALGFSLLVGIGFGIWPAATAGRLDPVQALYHN